MERRQPFDSSMLCWCVPPSPCPSVAKLWCYVMFKAICRHTNPLFRRAAELLLSGKNELMLDSLGGLKNHHWFKTVNLPQTVFICGTAKGKKQSLIRLQVLCWCGCAHRLQMEAFITNLKQPDQQVLSITCRVSSVKTPYHCARVRQMRNTYVHTLHRRHPPHTDRDTFPFSVVLLYASGTVIGTKKKCEKMLNEN